jgi:hypothetical protein
LGEHPELDELQTTYVVAVESWIAAIRKEEALASVLTAVARSSRSASESAITGLWISAEFVIYSCGRASVPVPH